MDQEILNFDMSAENINKKTNYVTVLMCLHEFFEKVNNRFFRFPTIILISLK